MCDRLLKSCKFHIVLHLFQIRIGFMVMVRTGTHCGCEEGIYYEPANNEEKIYSY